jgi:heavy metal sensor kinase
MSFVHSIKFRFTIWYLIVLGVLLVLLSTGVYLYLSLTLHEDLDDSLELRAAQLQDVKGIHASIRQGSFQEELGEIVSLYFYSDDELVVVSPRGVDIPVDREMIDQAIAGESSFATVEMEGGEELRLYAVPLSPDGTDLSPGRPRPFPGLPDVFPGEPDIGSGAVIIGRPTEGVEDALEGLMRILIIAVPLTMAVAGGGGVFLARRALKPVENIAQTARKIEESDLSQRIEVNTKDELGRLGSTLNQMIGRLEKAFGRQRQFTGDASHELRTPLAIIKAESTLALQKERKVSDYRESLEMISREADHMSVIIDQLLTLARADSGQEQLAFEEIDLGELVSDLASDVEILCREKGLEFRHGQMENLIVKGDRAKLKRLFLTLLDNAIRYTPSGGSVSLWLAREEQSAIVTIKDTGMGILPEDIPHVFERFYRVDKARSRAEGGIGLGLAICHHIAQMHGAKIEVESQVGEGSTFRVSLPHFEQA